MIRWQLVVAVGVAAIGIGLGWGWPATPASQDAVGTTPPATNSGTPGDTPTDDHAATVPELTRRSPPTPRTILAQRWAFDLLPADVGNQIEAPALAADGDGHVVLAWASQTGENERTLWLTRATVADANWTAPTAFATSPIHRAVSEMRGKKIERALHLLPLLSANRNRMALSWVVGGELASDVVMRYAASTDGGSTFAPAIDVHRSRAARPTFTGMSMGADGTVLCSWLDQRNDVQQPHAACLRPDAVEFEPEVMVSAGQNGTGTCPCCPTQPLVTPEGELLVSYRGHWDGFRDIWLGSTTVSIWGPMEPRPIVEPTWTFDGCPHDGASLAATPMALHVAWMDAHEGIEQVYYARRHSGGQSFATRPLLSSPKESQGHPCVAVHERRVVIVWDQAQPVADATVANAPAKSEPLGQPVKEPRSSIAAASHAPGDGHRGPGGHGNSHSGGAAALGGGRSIAMCESLDEGSTFGPVTILSDQPGVFQTRPRVAIDSSGDTWLAWNELTASGKQVVVARVDGKPSHAVPAPQTAAISAGSTFNGSHAHGN